MLGAGIVLLIFGLLALVIGRGLRGSGGDVFAFVYLPFYLGGTALSVAGVLFIIIGLTGQG